MTDSFSQKTVLITGATRGLGTAIAHHFWQAGANLILIARTQQALEDLRDQLNLNKKLKHQYIEMMSVDLAKAQQTEKLIQIIQQKQIDILINNAAIQGPIGPIWENDWQAWQETLQVNLLSPAALCRAILPSMVSRGYGKMINLSGGGAAKARPMFSAYATAKSGLVRLTETLAQEVKPYNIDINCISPGMMNTQLLNEIIIAGQEKAGEIEFNQVKEKIEKSENDFARAAELCLFLASEKSKGITGKLIHAVWDPWQDLPGYINEIQDSDIYTLRRIVPSDRGKKGRDA